MWASSPGNVILGTATIRIQDNEGYWVPIRAFLDTSPQISIITSAFVSRLGSKSHSSHISVMGLTHAQEITTMGATSCIFTLIYSEFFNLKRELKSKIVGLMPSSHLHSENRKAYSRVRFSRSRIWLTSLYWFSTVGGYVVCTHLYLVIADA